MIGTGVYTLGEAARYTELPSTTLRTWFKPRSDGRGRGPLFHSDYEVVARDFAISFINLIEAHVASFFRNKGIKPTHIRKVHQILKDEWGMPNPFAFADLGTDGKSIILSRADDAALIDVLKRQMVFETARPHLLRIDYNTTTRLASSWRVADGVLINPKIGFGKPVVESTGVSTLIVANQYLANRRDAAIVAKLFNIPPGGVVSAFEFERKLKRIAA